MYVERVEGGGSTVDDGWLILSPENSFSQDVLI